MPIVTMCNRASAEPDKRTLFIEAPRNIKTGYAGFLATQADIKLCQTIAGIAKGLKTLDISKVLNNTEKFTVSIECNASRAENVRTMMEKALSKKGITISHAVYQVGPPAGYTG